MNADKPPTLEHLKTNTRQIMVEIPPNTCQKVIENYLKSTSACNTSHGGLLNDVGFHTKCQRSNLTKKKNKKKIMKKFFICVLFMFTFETMKW